MDRWMLYGCTGFTGKLIIEEAMKRGQKPILAGRSEKKIIALAKKYNLPHAVFPIDNHTRMVRELSKVKLLVNLAGPYIYTCNAFINACLDAEVHYLDLCNEIYPLQKIFAYNKIAEDRGIAIIPDVGFNTVTSDCLAKYVSMMIPNPQNIEICIDALKKPSPGTIKGSVDVFSKGGLIIKNNKLKSIAIGEGTMKIDLPGRQIYASPTPMGDLLTVSKSTGIPDIMVSIPSHPLISKTLKLISPFLMPIAASKAGRKAIFYLTDKIMKGPDEAYMKTERSNVWVSVSNRHGEHFEASVETPEPYLFTAMTTVRAVEKVLDSAITGTLTPSQAFGYDFLTSFESVKRTDLLYAYKVSV